MKPVDKYSKLSIPNFLITLLVLGILAFSSGCDKKHVAMIGEKAPEISGNDIHGKVVSLDQLKGNVVVLCFWASCCCGDRVKQLEPFSHQNRDKGVKILTISEGSTRDAAESYAKSNGLTFTIQTDESGVTAREYGVFGYPTLFIIDREGAIRKKILGDIDTVQINKTVAQYLAK